MKEFLALRYRLVRGCSPGGGALVKRVARRPYRRGVISLSRPRSVSAPGA